MTKRIVKMKGQPLILEGKELKTGDKAPSFVLTDLHFRPVTQELFKGKIVILSCVPSLDTSTCSLETGRFNEEAAHLSKEVIVVTVSKDLPFAQARWCSANSIENIVVLSDYKNTGFARDYGVLLSDLGLLARALFLIDKKGIIRYIQFVDEISEEPDYRAVLSQTHKLLNEKGV